MGTAASVLVTLLSYLLCPGDPLTKTKKGVGTRIPQSKLFLVGNGMKAYLSRVTGFLIVYVIFLCLTTASQIVFFSHEHGGRVVLTDFCPGGQNPQSCLLMEGGCMPDFSKKVFIGIFFLFFF